MAIKQMQVINGQIHTVIYALDDHGKLWFTFVKAGDVKPKWQSIEGPPGPGSPAPPR